MTEERLRPERAAKSASESERGWGPASTEKDDRGPRMKQLTVAILMMLTSAPGAQQAPADIPFDSVPNLLKLPADVYLGEPAGVAVNSKGHLFVFSRGAHTQLFEFDRDGRFLREIGKGLYGFDFAHVVRVDQDD